MHEVYSVEADHDLRAEQPLVKARLAPARTCRWSSPVDIMIDTGSNATILPRALLKELGIEFEVVGSDAILGVGGIVIDVEVARLDICLPAVGGGTICLLGVKVMVAEGVVIPLLGMNILRHLNLHYSYGRGLELTLNPRAVTGLRQVG